VAHRVLQPGSSLVNYTICTGKLALFLSVAFPYHFSFVLTSYFTPFIHFQDILPEIVIFPSTYVFVQPRKCSCKDFERSCDHKEFAYQQYLKCGGEAVAINGDSASF
jgi:hypothetical protein